MQQQQASPLITLSPNSPSFNSYSSGQLAEIAARVVQEFATGSDDDCSSIFSWKPPLLQENNDDGGGDGDGDEEDFEFAIVQREPDGASPISADEIFYNGQIRPVYPLFNTALLLDREELADSSSGNTVVNNERAKKPSRLPLRKLFSEERETASCSSSEADDLESLPAGTYCVWTPKKKNKEEEEPSAGGGQKCKKSSSTGSSKRWKFRDLLYRSNSEGKDTFVFVTRPAKKSERAVMEDDEGKENYKEKDQKGEKGVVEEHFVKSRAVKEGHKRRSLLPYRQNLVGFFSNVNGLSRNLHPF